MAKTAEPQREDGRTARELLRFLNEMMRTIAQVDLGQAGIAELTLLELRVLVAVGESGQAMEIRELAELGETSVGQSSQACHGLRSRGLIDRAGGGRGPERTVAISSRGRRLLSSLAASRQVAVEGF